MDYSLLVGIHFKDISPDRELIPSESTNPSGTFKSYEVLYNTTSMSVMFILSSNYKNLSSLESQKMERAKELLEFQEQTWTNSF